MQNLSIFDINISSKLTGIFEQLQSTLRKFDFSDIKEKELYSKVQSINPKQDIVLEDIEWLYEDYEKLSDVFDGLDSDFSFLDSELANYLKKIIYSRNIAKREKIVILISHIEKLIEECLDESFGKSGIKQEVKNAINSKLDKVTGANIGRCYILAITNIVFARTDAITNAISDACEPAIRPDVALQTIKDKTVIVVEILPGAQRPYYIKSLGMVDGTYVRVAGTTRHVEGYMLKELILEGQNRYFDSEICQNMPVSDSEIEELCKSMKETALKNTWQDSEKAKIKDVTKNTLISWGVLKDAEGKVYPTNAYALLTGKMSQMPVIQCGVFKGTNRAHFVDRREFEGSIQAQMEAAYQYVLEKINMGMTIMGMYRQDVYELPTDSIRELIANAVAHRSYLDPGNIQVALFDDRLEVTSPGMLLNNVTISKMMEGYSKPRNPAIARAFAYMKIIEKWGTGIPRLFEACEEYGLPKPELIDFDGDFRVNMYRKVKGEFGVNGVTTQTTQTHQSTQSKKSTLSDDDKKILELVHNYPSMSQREYANELGWNLDRVKYYLRKMKTQELIKRVGNSHSGYWEVLAEVNQLQN